MDVNDQRQLPAGRRLRQVEIEFLRFVTVGNVGDVSFHRDAVWRLHGRSRLCRRLRLLVAGGRRGGEHDEARHNRGEPCGGPDMEGMQGLGKVHGVCPRKNPAEE